MKHEIRAESYGNVVSSIMIHALYIIRNKKKKKKNDRVDILGYDGASGFAIFNTIDRSTV